MARTNYKFQKRQKEIARKKKKEEKRLAKLDSKIDQPEQDSGASSNEDDLQSEQDSDASPNEDDLQPEQDSDASSDEDDLQ